MSKRNYYFAAAGLFLLFALLVVICNHDDWDFFFSAFEVDLRSWLIDHAPPVWSYQFCAGSTRLGDPQAFGLSPLFLPVIIFGSFAGAKVLVLGCVLGGYFSLAGILRLLAGEDGAETSLACGSVALFTLGGNYFLWHFAVGHLSFALIPFTWVIAFLFLRLVKGKGGAGTACGLFLTTFAWLTAGLYHSLVFFAVPLCLILAAAFAAHLARGARPFGRLRYPRIALALLACALATAAASYRLLGVIHYQELFPRAVDSTRDTNSLLHMLVYFFVPTVGHQFAGAVEFLDLWGVHEYSAFGFLPWAALAALVWQVRRREGWRALGGFELAAAFLVAVLFAVGGPLSPHSWLNALVYHGSVRGLGRYHALLLLVAAAFLARLVGSSAEFRALYLRRFLPVGLAVQALGILVMFPLGDPGLAARLALAPVGAEPAMNTLVRVPDRVMAARSDSFMYPAIRLGGIVLNCYQPMARLTPLASESEFNAKALGLRANGTAALITSRGGALSEACVRSAYVTQNETAYDAAACGHDLCFRLNMLNPSGESNLKFSEPLQLYCAP